MRLSKKSSAAFFFAVLSLSILPNFFLLAIDITACNSSADYVTASVSCTIQTNAANNDPNTAVTSNCTIKNTPPACQQQVPGDFSMCVKTSSSITNNNIESCNVFPQPCANNGEIPNNTNGVCENPSTINLAKAAGSCKADQTLLIENPVNPVTGNKFRSETDLTTSSDLSFTRYYNSLPDIDIGLGQGWAADYFQQLTLSGTLVDVIRSDGQQLAFNCPLAFTSSCISDPDIKIELAKASTGFTLTTEDDVVEKYDTAGNLLSITPRSGETQTLSYNATTDLLDTVTDTYGRTLTFAYDTNDRLTSVTDPNGEVYTYSYDSSNNLISVTFPDETPGNPNDNPSKQYEYTDVSFPNHLTGIIDENGNTFASFGYDTQGRAIFTELANGAERADLTYNVDGTTTVTDSLGSSNLYSYDIIYGLPHTASVTGGQCGSGCSNQGQAQTYDANGFLATRTDFEGNLTTFINNVRGLQESRTEAIGTPEERTITTEWHPTFRLPTKITKLGKETIFTYDGQGRLLSRTESESP